MKIDRLILLILVGMVGCNREPPPPVESARPVESPVVQAAAAHEPEEGSSPRRVRWAEVPVDPPPGPLEKLVKAGEGIYRQQCQVCHGAQGKGDGPAAELLASRPRNFTRGMFKFRTSPPEEMPFDDDLYRTISAGIPASGMPSFGDLTPFERWALVAYVKHLSKYVIDENRTIDHFAQYPAKTRMKLPAPPDRSVIDLKRGEKLYREQVKCMQCHGVSGVGDGPSAEWLEDSLGFPIKATDLTRGEVTFRAGSKPEDIFRVLTTGMPGTPMPSFASLSEQDRWNLAYYVTSLYRPIEPGERLYLKVGCTSCHTIGKGKLIGPDLAGVLQRRERGWLRRWLKDPPSMLATDEQARKLLEEYQTPMPSYGLTEKEVEMLIQYLEKLPPASAEKK